MTPRRLLIAGLIGLCLAGTPALTAAAATWCRPASETACQCCHTGGHGQGCQMSCSEPFSISGMTSSDHTPIPRQKTVHTSWFDHESAWSYRLASASTVLAGYTTPAPPPKRYLLACTFRL